MMTPVQHQLACPDSQGTHLINYWEWGATDNPQVVVCIHGLTRNSRDFDFLAQALATDKRVLCLDMAGRGHSEWLANPADYGYPLYVADVLAVLAHAKVTAAAVEWVGTSMGALIGMALVNLPEPPVQLRRMVMNDIGPLLPKAALERLSNALHNSPVSFADMASLEAHLRQVLAPFGALTDAQWQHLAQQSSRSLANGGYRLAYDPAIAHTFPAGDTLADIELWDLWDNVRCPVLVLHGVESDLLLPATIAQMQSTHPDIEVVDIPEVGHAPALMDAEQIGLIVNWLSG